MESHQPVTFPSCGSIKVFLETITILLGFDSFVDDAVVGEQSEFAGFQIFWSVIYIYQKKNRTHNCSLRDTKSDWSNI
jgi:hypothetical protein